MFKVSSLEAFFTISVITFPQVEKKLLASNVICDISEYFCHQKYWQKGNLIVSEKYITMLNKILP